MPTLPVEERIDNFGEVDLGYTGSRLQGSYAVPELRGRRIGCRNLCGVSQLCPDMSFWRAGPGEGDCRDRCQSMPILRHLRR